MADVLEEAARRRTFAIISHPDAGKTTLTEKFLLYGGALSGEAGAVRGRGGQRAATSDWMEMEQKRGISITSTVLQFPHRNHVLNLLDTPGHRDFSEDTYRVLAAADAAIMVLDAAKGIEPQTLKLFEVCRDRGLPLLSFINKWDRPGLGALELIDEIEQQIGLSPTPVTWPVGLSGDFRGVAHRGGDGGFTRFTRTSHGSTMAPEEHVAADRAADEEGRGLGRRPGGAGPARRHRPRAGAQGVPGRRGDAGLLRLGPHELRRRHAARRRRRPRPAADAPHRRGRGAPPARRAVRRLRLQGAGQHGPVAPGPDRLLPGRLRPLRAGHGRHSTTRRASPSPPSTPTRRSGASGRRSRRPTRATWSGWSTPPSCGWATRLFDELPISFGDIPSFAPNHFSTARVTDTGRYKQFRRGISQLDEEGVVQVLRDPDLGDQAPVLAAVGPMQFDVAKHRLENEFGAPVEFYPTSYRVARLTDAESEPALRGMSGVTVLRRADGARYALFE